MGHRHPMSTSTTLPARRPLIDVIQALERFMPYYASVHRGTGFKSRLSTEAYDRAHAIVARFFGADPQTQAVAFGKNTTEAINKLSYRLPVNAGHVIISTQLEHHSDDLPWRRAAEVVHVRATADGRLDEDDFDSQLERHAGRIALVAISGASNVTGFIQPIHALARKAHDAGSRILVDAAQLAPHRAIDMRPDDDPEHLDFLAISAHKMYAPYGTGALIGPRDLFLASPPEYRGGGTIDVVTLDDVVWAGLPDREEAGSPNVVGAVALAAAIQTLDGWACKPSQTMRHRWFGTHLSVCGLFPAWNSTGTQTRPAPMKGWGSSPSIWRATPILRWRPSWATKAGSASAVAASVPIPMLFICWACPMTRRPSGGVRYLPGTRRTCRAWCAASFGCYNNTDDVDRMVEMLQRIARGDVQGTYQVDKATGEYMPVGHEEDLDTYFAL